MSDINTGQLDGANYLKTYAAEAGLEERDMPSPHHPLLQNDDTIESLGDLVDARADQHRDPLSTDSLGQVPDANLDVSEALTFPHTGNRATSSADRTPAITDFDADARTPSDPDDADDASYMTRADLADSMLMTDPDPNAGMDADDTIADAGLDRAPDLTGTVGGLARGTATHLPQDGPASGFQIEEPETLDPALATDTVPTPDEADTNDGDRLETRAPNVNSRDEALDATRRLR